jgi:hypothetical protein
MPRLAKLAWFAIILMAVPTILPAVSLSTPNNKTECTGAEPNPQGAILGDNVPGNAGTGKKMSLRFKVTGGSTFNVTSVPVAACDDGNVVARKFMDQIVSTAVPPWVCVVNSPAGGVCGGASNDPTGALRQDWDIFKAPGDQCGFNLLKASSADTTKVDLGGDPTGTCVPTVLNASTNAGNSFEFDLLPFYRFQVVPNGIGGIATLAITHNQGGVNPRVVTVDTSGKKSAQIMTEFKAGIEATGLGLNTSLHGSSHAAFPTAFNSLGLLVEVSNAQARQVVEFTVTAPPGQDNIQETGGPAPSTGVPALSPWGVAFLVGVLLLTSIWMLRRRVRNSEI